LGADRDLTVTPVSMSSEPTAVLVTCVKEDTTNEAVDKVNIVAILTGTGPRNLAG